MISGNIIALDSVEGKHCKTEYPMPWVYISLIMPFRLSAINSFTI